MNNFMNGLFDLTGRIAVVTGSSRGIGKSSAIALAEAGADIILIQRDVNNTATKQDIEKLGRRCGMIECNMRDSERVKEVVGEAVGIFGHIDILVNNAGIQYHSPAVDFPDEAWDEVMLVNLKSMSLLCREAGRYMLSHGGGKIINIASLMSFSGRENIAAYSASKGGVAQLTKALSNEWAKFGVNVNAIAPGYLATDMNPGMENDKGLAHYIPIGRIGFADDMKGSVVFLASRASDYVCGHILAADGGMLAK